MTEKDCNDYIMRGDVVGALLLSNRVFKTGFYSDEIISDTIEAAVKAVEILPAADVRPERHGKWIANFDDFTPANRCSKCKVNFPEIAGSKTVYSPNLMHYCPNCGAKMDGNTEQTQATD